jgi:hypothetical protein
MRAIPFILMLAVVCSCAKDPFQRPHTWTLPPDGTGANDANLRAMVANPNDLTTGTSDGTGLGHLAVRPVDALLGGHRRSLPTVNASTIGASGMPSGGGAAALGSGGTQ